MTGVDAFTVSAIPVLFSALHFPAELPMKMRPGCGAGFTHALSQGRDNECCHTVSPLALGLEADWACPHLLCRPKLNFLLPVSRKVNGKKERGVESRRARHSAAGFA